MQLVNADLHIHSKYSISTSKYMTFDTLSQEAPKKGIHLVGTGDCLHHKWLQDIKTLEKVDEGTFELNNTRFIPTVEIQGEKRVHHLIIFPSLSAVEQFREQIKSKSKNLDTDGRPHVPMTGEELAELAFDVDALIGPCHAFTPWTGMYGHFESLQECYGQYSKKISFLELGLSADSSYADRISELHDLTFLSNSDAHSPYPLRLGREFNQFKVEDMTFKEIKKAILRNGGRKCILNVGLPPEEGKYNQSGCSRCFKRFSYSASLEADWKCSCGGRIKKGVSDRVSELGANYTPKKPEHRPDYLHIIPLAVIISKAINCVGTNTKSVQKIWTTLVSKFHNEIEVLIDTEIEKITEVMDPRISWAIECFRNNKIILHPGGGGRYGQIELPKFE